MESNWVDELDSVFARNPHGSAAGLVVMHRGQVIAERQHGTLADDDPTPVTEQTWFDLASVTKVVTAITMLTLVERGLVGFDEPLHPELPAYEHGAKRDVTLRHLLSHTSGLPAEWRGWREASNDAPRDELLSEVCALPLETEPGSAWTYSCVGYLTAMAFAEARTGKLWPQIVHDFVLEPLHLTDGLTFTPDAAQTAATETDQVLNRGLVRGVVHDEAAFTLGGSCGNAGLFGTAMGLAQLGELIRTNQLTCSDTLLWANALPEILGRSVANPGSEDFGHSLGLRIGQQPWMGDTSIHPSAAESRGHTGFTGTSLLINRELELTIALLTNRVHPTRELTDVTELRAAINNASYAHITKQRAV